MAIPEPAKTQQHGEADMGKWIKAGKWIDAGYLSNTDIG